jgi:RNA polymerase sigma-70 factor (ECF subfamily)
MTPEELARERPYLFGIAYRMLGSAADAEDVLQEAFLRARTIEDARSPRAMLATIVTRLCLDEVRSARRRREEYVGPWLPEPIASAEPWTTSTADKIADAESMSMAFLVLLESLSPLERAVYVLREVLDYDFEEVAAAVGRTEAACRQLFHRAKAHVTERRKRFPAAPAAQKTLTASFMGALVAGDLDALARLFTDDVQVVPDHGGKAKSHTRTVVGADRASRYFAGMYGRFRDNRYVDGPTGSRLAWINGAPGMLQLAGDAIVGAVIFDVVDEGGAARIAQVHVVRNPDKLAALRAGTKLSG